MPPDDPCCPSHYDSTPDKEADQRTSQREGQNENKDEDEDENEVNNKEEDHDEDKGEGENEDEDEDEVKVEVEVEAEIESSPSPEPEADPAQIELPESPYFNPFDAPAADSGTSSRRGSIDDIPSLEDTIAYVDPFAESLAKRDWAR
ncbi:hypothetical protein J3F83DRAFT_600968 [Trichoderma novae-zelandiae]